MYGGTAAVYSARHQPGRCTWRKAQIRRRRAQRRQKRTREDHDEALVLWVALGKSSPDIAVILGMSDATAKKHVCNILAKLGCETRSAATLRALEALSA